MNVDIELRWASRDDYDAIGEVMFDAVRNGRSKYSEDQRQAWVPEPRTGDEWNSRLGEQDIIVAEAPDKIVGFMSLAPNDDLDFAYIRPDFQGRGLFRRLYEKIESLALERQQERIRVHASLMAQPAFSKVGFQIIKRACVTIADADFDRFEMEKILDVDKRNG